MLIQSARIFKDETDIVWDPQDSQAPQDPGILIKFTTNQDLTDHEFCQFLQLRLTQNDIDWLQLSGVEALISGPRFLDWLATKKPPELSSTPKWFDTPVTVPLQFKRWVDESSEYYNEYFTECVILISSDAVAASKGILDQKSPTQTSQTVEAPSHGVVVNQETNYQIVLLIHGIRTNAEWQSMVEKQLSVSDKVIVRPIGYGYFDVLRFWFPFWTRNRPIERVHEEIRVAQQKYQKVHPNAKLSIIAHSFGTYIVGEILKKDFTLKLHRLILCGSVLPQDFPWNHLQGRFNDENTINECGKADIWPAMAQCLSWGYGASGTHGFKRVLIKDRFHAGGHGQYFEPEFVDKYWEPFIKRGEYQGTEFEKTRPPTPWWLSVLGILPLRHVLTVVLVAISVLGIYGFMMRSGLGRAGPIGLHATQSESSLKSSPATNCLLSPGDFDSLLDEIRAKQLDKSLASITDEEWKWTWSIGTFAVKAKLVLGAVAGKPQRRRIRDSSYVPIIKFLALLSYKYMAADDFEMDAKIKNCESPDGFSLVSWIRSLQATVIDDPSGKLVVNGEGMEQRTVIWWLVFFGYFEACNDKCTREWINNLESKTGDEPSLRKEFINLLTTHIKLQRSFLDDQFIRPTYREWYSERKRGISINPQLYVDRLKAKIKDHASELKVNPIE